MSTLVILIDVPNTARAADVQRALTAAAEQLGARVDVAHQVTEVDSLRAITRIGERLAAPLMRSCAVRARRRKVVPLHGTEQFL